MIINNQKTVHVSRAYECSVEQLFNQWQPEQMVLWWENLAEVTMPEQIGAKVNFKWHGFDGYVDGVIEEYEQNKAIGFTWVSSRTNHASKVRILFEETDKGSCLNLFHENNVSFEDASSHNHGWIFCLDYLSKVINKQPREKEVVLKRTFHAPIEMVFDAWSSPLHMVQWMNFDETKDPVCDVDFQVGGNFRLDHHARDNSIHCHYGRYKEIDPPNKLVFTWLSDHTEGETEVTVQLKKIGDTTTELELRHRFFLSQKAADGHQEGWSSLWDRMESILSK